MKGIIKQYELFYRDVSKTTKFQTYARIFHKRQESYGVNSLYKFEDLLIDLNVTDGKTTGVNLLEFIAKFFVEGATFFPHILSCWFLSPYLRNDICMHIF